MNAPVVVPITIDYTPRHQFIPYHLRTQRYAALICHRRAGKTVSSINDQLRRALTERKPEGRYAFVFPQRNQAKDTAWRYLKRYSAPIQTGPPSESELRVDLPGGTMMRLYGADNPDALRGPYLDGVVFDEFGDMDPDVWFSVVRPMLADRRGWATFIGTIKGANSFWTLFEAAQRDPVWYTMMLKASQSGILPQDELDEMRLTMGEDQYQQEMECNPHVAIKGAFYADEMRVMEAEGRIRPITIDKSIRVRTGWDIGRTDSTAITFWQCVGHERRLIDYYEAAGKSLKHYADVLWEKKREFGYQYAEHYWPHDMAYHMIDSDKSRIEQMAAEGIKGEIVPAHDVLEGVNAVRKALGKVWIDPNRCKRIIDALRQYRREWDSKLQMWKPNEYKDWTNHGCDSVRTFVVGHDDQSPLKPKKERRETKNDAGSTSWAA